MPFHNVPESVSYDSSITAMDNGEAATAENFEPTYTGLANRTAFLKSKTDLIDTGVPRIRSAADTTAMAALTGMSDGDACLITATNLFYFFNDAAFYTADNVLIFDSTTVSGAHWFAYNWFTVDVDNGPAFVGPNIQSPTCASGKIPVTLQTNYLVDIGVVTNGTPIVQTVTNQATPVVLANSDIPTNISCLAGDIIEIDYETIRVDSTVSLSPGYMYLEIIEDYGGANVTNVIQRYNAGVPGTGSSLSFLSPRIIHTCSTPGIFATRLLFSNAASDCEHDIITTSGIPAFNYVVGTFKVFRP